MFNPRARVLQVAVEYHAPHWIVLIRNAGQKEWSALRDPDTKISVQDEFGAEIQTRPAIKSFPTVTAASEFVTENLKEAERVGQRSAEDVTAFVIGLNKPRANLQAMHPTSA